MLALAIEFSRSAPKPALSFRGTALRASRARTLSTEQCAPQARRRSSPFRALVRAVLGWMAVCLRNSQWIDWSVQLVRATGYIPALPGEQGFRQCSLERR